MLKVSIITGSRVYVKVTNNQDIKISFLFLKNVSYLDMYVESKNVTHTTFFLISVTFKNHLESPGKR